MWIFERQVDPVSGGWSNIFTLSIINYAFGALAHWEHQGLGPGNESVSEGGWFVEACEKGISEKGRHVDLM